MCQEGLAERLHESKYEEMNETAFNLYYLLKSLGFINFQVKKSIFIKINRTISE